MRGYHGCAPHMTPCPAMLPFDLRLPCFLLLTALTVACSPSPSPPPAAAAGDTASITLSHAWVRQPPPGATVAGAYLSLTNPGPRADRLLGVDSPAAERVEIHDMQVVSGMMQMRKLEQGLALPAGETTTLAPGGLHLMLIAPTAELGVGDTVTMTLTFEHAPAQTLDFEVQALVENDDASHEVHHGHHGRH